LKTLNKSPYSSENDDRVCLFSENSDVCHDVISWQTK